MAKAAWWRGGVIYQIYPRSFQDSTGNGIGDINGITSRLDYIADLGANAIWVSPFFTSPMKDFGYDVSDYCDVDPLFGSLGDFDALLERAHLLGLKVMIDQVWSHTSDQHAWFAESRQSQNNQKSDWYTWADAKPDGSPPNNWQSVFGGSAWTWDTRREQYYLHNFLKEQPDLNFHNDNVRQRILGVAKFWLDRGVDGFRLDVCNMYFQHPSLADNPVRADGRRGPNPHDWQHHVYCRNQPEMLPFLNELRALTDSYGDICLMGEIGDNDGLPIMMEYTQGDDRLHTAYCFDFLSPKCDAPFLRQILDRWISEGEGWPTWALGNHDFPRVASRWTCGQINPKQLRLFAAFQMCLKGTICLYQGEELGLEQASIAFADLQDPEGIALWPQKPGRDGCRTPMPWTTDRSAGFSECENTWLPIPDAHKERAVITQTVDNDSLFSFYKDILTTRRSETALLIGDMELLPEHKSVLAFNRRHQGQEIVCAFNFSDSSATICAAGNHALKQMKASGARVESGSVLLEPWGWMIAEKEA